VSTSSEDLWAERGNVGGLPTDGGETASEFTSPGIGEMNSVIKKEQAISKNDPMERVADRVREKAMGGTHPKGPAAGRNENL